MAKRKLKPDFADWDYNKLVEYVEAYLLKQFITEGGKGLHNAVFSMLQLAIQWHKFQ